MKRVLKSMSIYGLGGMLSRSLQFLLLPVYTRVLSPADYGGLELTAVIASIMAILYGLLVSSGYVRNYYDTKDDSQRQELLASALWFTFGLSLVFAFLFFFFSDALSLRLFGLAHGAIYIRIITVTTFVFAHNQILYNLLMVEQRAMRFMAINVIGLVASLSCIIFFVVRLHWSVQGVLFGQLCGTALECCLLLLTASDRDFFRFSWKKTRAMLAYALPLIPLQIASFVIELSDRYFIQRYWNLHEVGMYSLGYKFAAILPLFAVQPLRGFTPYIFSLINTPDACKRTLANFFRYYLAGILIITLMVSVFAREALLIMADSSFHESWHVVFVLSLSYVLYGSINLISYAIEIERKNWISGIFWCFAAVINTLLNIMLIPRYGVMGAALSTTISYAVIMICYFIAVNRIYYVPFAYTKLLVLTGATSGVYYVSTLFQFGLPASLAMKFLLMCMYLAALYKGGYFTREEIHAAKELVAGYWTGATFRKEQ